MVTYISLLRGINVSGQKKVPMEKLKALYESLGFKNVQTYIQSGNVIFECSDKDVFVIRNKIELKIRNVFGFDVTVIIRTKDELRKVLERNPFSGKETKFLCVTFLATTPASLPREEIASMKHASEEFAISGREVYLFCPGGYGKTKLSNNLFERKLKVSATTRNWTTVQKLLELANTLNDRRQPC